MKLKKNPKKAQSFLEYSFLIAIAVVTLLAMGSYLSRGMQGNLKQHVDNLGGERVTGDTFTPGKWYGDGDFSNVAKITSWAFEYEGREGFSVMTGGMKRSDLNKITGTANLNEVPEANINFESQLSGEEKALVNSVFGSSFDPGMDVMVNNVNSQTPHFSSPNGGIVEMGEFAADSLSNQAVGIVEEYVTQPDINQAQQDIETFKNNPDYNPEDLTGLNYDELNVDASEAVK
ncbi:MAG: hypothetical protein ABH872_00620 [Candidatus Omnitrophota bacterium]